MNSVIVAISLLRAMNRLFITLCFMVAPHWRTLIYQNIKSNISDQASAKVLPRQFKGRGNNSWEAAARDGGRQKEGGQEQAGSAGNIALEQAARSGPLKILVGGEEQQQGASMKT